jgi:hypothetical protein
MLTGLLFQQICDSYIALRAMRKYTHIETFRKLKLNNLCTVSRVYATYTPNAHQHTYIQNFLNTKFCMYTKFFKYQILYVQNATVHHK